MTVFSVEQITVQQKMKEPKKYFTLKTHVNFEELDTFNIRKELEKNDLYRHLRLAGGF